MTKITDDTRREDYTAAASQTVFPYSFEILDSADLDVYIDGVLQSLTTHYTLSGVGVEGGGNVTLVTPATGGEVVLLHGDKPKERQTEFETGQQVLLQAELNSQIAALTIMCLENEREISRAIRADLHSVSPTMQLPAVADREGKFAYFSDPGGNLEMAELLIAATVLSQSVVGGYLYPQTQAEIDAGVTPTNIHFPELYLQRYGNGFDGATDDAGAFSDAFAVLAAKGRGYIIGNNLHCAIASPIGILSQKSGNNGGFSQPMDGSGGVFAIGMRLDYSGTDHCFTLQGSGFDATDPRRFDWIGGTYKATSTGGVFKFRDCGRLNFQPEHLHNGTANIMAIIQNWESWSENISVTGPFGSTLTMTDNLVAIELQGKIAAEAYEGSASPGATESFARFRGYNWQVGTIANSPANAQVLSIKGSMYDGLIEMVGGNMDNADTDRLVNIQGGCTRTHFRDWRLEGANSGGSPVAAMFSSEISTVEDTTISFTATDTISDTNNNLGAMVVGNKIRVQGTDTNDGDYEIATVAAGAITTVETTLLTEAAGATVTLTERPDVSDQAYPLVQDCDWTGGQATVKQERAWGKSVTNSGGDHYTNEAFHAPISFPGVIVPAAVTADKHDWMPHDETSGKLWANATVIELDGTTDFELTGLADGYSERLVIVINTGTAVALVKVQDVASGTAKRFATAQDVPIPGDSNAIFLFNGNRWRCLAHYTGAKYVNEEETAVNIADVAHAINTVGAFLGKKVWDTTNKREMRKAGPLAADEWAVTDGSAQVTPA